MKASIQEPELRERALGLVRRYGWNNTSFQTLEPYFEYWFDDEGPGMVAFYRAWGTWVAAGAPVCPHDRIRACALGFAAAARRAKYRACFFGTLERFTAELGDQATSIKIGEQPWWDPQRWGQLSARRRTVGAQLRRAARRGVDVRQIPAAEMADPDTAARQRAESVINAWQRAHRMATMSFVVHIDPFSFAEQRRYFLAEQTSGHEPSAAGDRLAVGFLALVPVYARDGWFLEDLVRTPHAPNGTAEALIDRAMQTIAHEGSRYATLGLSPLKGIDSPRDGEPGWVRVIFALARRGLSPLYNFEGLAAFKTKFRPEGWEQVYLTAIPRVTPLMLLSVLAAFAHSRPTSFAGMTLRRLVGRAVRRTSPATWRSLTLAFAMTLLAWIALLGQADSRYWFGSDTMRDIWIGFDCVMVALFLLIAWGAGRRASFVAPLSLVALGAVVADCVLTTGQAIAFHLQRWSSLVDTIVWLVALSGPTLAALFLFALASASAAWKGTAPVTGTLHP